MPRHDLTSQRFDVKMWDLKGREFFGRFIGLAEKNPNSLKVSHRLLRIRGQSFLKAADIIVSPDGNNYLLAEAPSTLFGRTVVSTDFKAIHLDQTLVVKRSISTYDSVTRQTVKGAPSEIATIQAQLEPLDQKQDRSSRITLFYERWALYTDFDLATGDVLNDKYVVAKVDKLSGVTYAQVE